MKKNRTLFLLLVLVTLCRAQTNGVQNLGNLCFMNHETIGSGVYPTSQLQEMSFDSLHLSANMASFVSNCHSKFFIVQNTGPLTSPSFSYLASFYYSPYLLKGNSVSGRF